MAFQMPPPCTVIPYIYQSTNRKKIEAKKKKIKKNLFVNETAHGICYESITKERAEKREREKSPRPDKIAGITKWSVACATQGCIVLYVEFE